MQLRGDNHAHYRPSFKEFDMLEQIVFALNLLGPKAIAAYIVVIIAIVAISLYARRGAATR